MSDLVRGSYAVTSPIKKLTANMNVSQSNIAARSNLEWAGTVAMTDGATALTTQVCTSVAVPVEYGDIISKVTMLVGATAAGSPTNSWAALYSGIATPALMAQSADGTSAAIAASGAFTFTLATPQVVTPVNAPNGFLYVSIMVKATVPTLASVTNATAVTYKWFTNSPLFLAATHGSALTTTAPATIVTPAAQALTPVVFLT